MASLQLIVESMQYAESLLIAEASLLKDPLDQEKLVFLQDIVFNLLNVYMRR